MPFKRVALRVAACVRLFALPSFCLISAFGVAGSAVAKRVTSDRGCARAGGRQRGRGPSLDDDDQE